MAKLAGTERAKLPDSAFAYIDSQGRRRLPIHDESHVRNALSRFNQVGFENPAARERARARLLAAAKKVGIVPIGFITAQLQATNRHVSLPSGFVTFLMTDIEGSTELLHRLGERYGPLLTSVRRILRAAVRGGRGKVIDERADEFFAVFRSPVAAIQAALTVQEKLALKRWPDGAVVRVRAGIHSGRPSLTPMGYIGLPVHTVARVCSAASGGQVLASGDTMDALAGPPDGVEVNSLGQRRLKGLPAAVELVNLTAGKPAPGRTGGPGAG
jgi:class 3 adenylate cyclase